MDIKGTDGPNKGKTIKTIYKLDGDTLVVCYELGDGAGRRNSRRNRKQSCSSPHTNAKRSEHGPRESHHHRAGGRGQKTGRRAAAEAAQGGHRPAEGRRAAGDRRPRSKKLKEPLGHILFDGPPGLGKTTFATVLPNELGTSIQMTSGPALSKPADLLPFLTNLEEGSILFIDEIHRMPRVVEEFIYPAMEDFRIDIVLGEGMNARTISMQLKRFTLIGATTRSGMLSGPMRDRFKMHEHLEFYSRRGAGHRSSRVNAGEAEHADHRRRGARTGPAQPRHAAHRQRPAVVGAAATPPAKHDGTITEEIARAALDMAEVDREGLDKQDRRYLETLIDVFGGGPTGVEALAATMNLRGRHAHRRDRAVPAARAVHRPLAARPGRDAEGVRTARPQAEGG